MAGSRVDVLLEYQDYYAKSLRLNPHIHELIEKQDAPERRHRWRVKLECGCTTEALTRDEEHPPTEGTTHALRETGHASEQLFVIDAGSRSRGMTPGYLWCSDHESPYPPWREITEWVERQGSASLKRQGTFVDHARWLVLLSCGHADAVFTDLDWQPSHGHSPNPDEAERTRQVLARAGSRLPDDLRREWEVRTDAGWPEPETGRLCRFCIYNRRIVSYEPIGLLTWPGDKERPSRAALQHRARAAESKADHLRAELARAEKAAAQLRRELDESAP